MDTSPADPGSSSDPRHLDGRSFGGTLDLSQNWLFHAGDDPSFASPQLDDSAWIAVSTHKPLFDYGFRNIVFCWYRLHVRVLPSSRNIAIGLASVSGAYEVFINGNKIGDSGRMVPQVYSHQGGLLTFPVPDTLVASTHGELVIALRVVADRTGEQGRGSASPINEDSTLLLESATSARYHSSYLAAHRGIGYLISAALALLVGFVSLALFLALRTQFEYLAIALFLLFYAAINILRIATFFGTYTFTTNLVVYGFEASANVALIEFVRIVLGLPRSPLFLILEVVCFLGEFGNATAQAAVGPFALSFIAYFLPMLAILLFLPILLLRGLRRGNADARVLLLAILIFSVSTYWVFAGWIAYYLHLTPHSPRSPSLTFSSYSISLALSSRICFYFAILLFLVLRTIRIARDRAHYAAEVEAAQTVQQVLLSRSAQDTPGFKVETVYLPASEVGGDFFLVSPGSDGALIALVGDVAGKGMLAAMRVSVILGALRREEARQPSAILEGLNDAMLRQGDMGMTTACCIRVEPEGRFTVANAGHISPYIAGPDRGQEFVTEGALPLGIVAGTAYKQTAGSLNPGESLVLMSDGVVEARSEKLGLYGFERLAPLTRLPAREIAETAKAFGQEDDITVVTVSCTG